MHCVIIAWEEERGGEEKIGRWGVAEEMRRRKKQRGGFSLSPNPPHPLLSVWSTKGGPNVI
ncbi:hypothetical protein A3D80_03340 [Candidatus Roizmanbacteria bacterium RIFCSPHIGHO2_02_FULL_40_13b]|uniref:Uncharacterized protein n=1 Tax=Candidatus Roizmanbacteria bacterium RIFCSPHIGHO2_01_FULL_39_24 TaxID=1802032 RepID=A0A1F7GLR8_9BACT|nr:MAG: hypothetical protein A2799_01085 [Candidatus Roizmanbacteria bacterium RIFCSPHIGHO2_01_FULL_39_24]OGK27000.1 MAG: hypothetical protein A3D80_03340 [Candidatus Roizmanbacteria bacterium RIFCSPHIGHO2_02_FULL_40_13b]OGK57321.1 MAG: hypothetical protein A3H83_00590 [Candidatus Roizmanbacteria bacterium RIFCSPLOWO2_02_FULL_39_8]